MGKKDVFNLKYDPDTDILHVSFGKAKEALSVEQEPEVFVRVDPKTQKTVGFTILGFKKYIGHKQNLQIPSYSSALLT